MISLLRVEADLGRGPVAATSPLNLDGIVMAAARPDVHPSRADELNQSVPIPIASLDVHGTSAHLSSDVDFLDCSPFPSHMSRRMDGVDVESRSRKVHRGAGPGRDKLRRFRSVVASRATWTVVGDADRLLALLRRIRSIGSMRGHGYGRVRSWRVEPIDGPPSLSLVRDHRAVRAVPAAWCVWQEDETAEPLPCRPPYWHRSSMETCVPPGRVAALKLTVLDAIASAVGS